MNQNPEIVKLLAQMDDIKGLDAISAWPPGPGWWVLLAILLATAAVTLFLKTKRKIWSYSWRGDASRTLDALEERLDEIAARDVAADLSVLLRRIAMKRHSRKECAGLEGREWLAWLQRHDPKGFDWTGQGSLLTEAPYAPPDAKFPPATVQILIAATRPWVA